jgi:hypothetical protein
MSHICFCPGKIKIKKNNQRWYAPVDNKNITYCEPCFKKYGDSIKNIQFYLNGNENNYCHWDHEDFKNSSILINNMRISVVNPITLYRYQVLAQDDISMSVGVPNNTPYMIVIENCDLYTDSRISIENIMHGDSPNIFDTRSKKNRLTILFMSYSSDLIFNENNNNAISFTISKWIKYNDNCCGPYYGLYSMIHNFTIELLRNDSENKNMRDMIKEFRMIDNNIKKIVVVDNFL